MGYVGVHLLLQVREVTMYLPQDKKKRDNYKRSPLLDAYFGGSWEGETNPSAVSCSDAGDLEIERYLESCRGVNKVLYV